MDSKRARVAAAEDHAFAEDFVAAAACVREACEEDPADAELWFLQGYYQARAGALDEAARSLAEALAIAPDHGLAHHTLANCLRDLGQVEPAAGHYRRALDRLGDDPDAIADYGLHHLRTGASDLARAMFERAVALDPACEIARRGLEATEHAAPIPPPGEPEGPAPAPGGRRERSPRGRGTRRGSAIGSDPDAGAPGQVDPSGGDHISALFFSADVDWPAVAAEAERTVERDAEDFEAWLRLGGACVRLRDFERAIPILERVLARTEGRGARDGVHATALGLLSEVLVEKQDALAAHRVGQTMQRLYPDRPLTLYLTGRISHLCGDPRQALRALKEAARLDPDGPVGRQALDVIARIGG